VSGRRLTPLTPRAGAIFAAAAKTPTGGAKRQKLLLLLAGFADAGEESPPMRDLSKRLRMPPPAIDALLQLLERDGVVEVTWSTGPHERNRYELRLDGERRPA